MIDILKNAVRNVVRKKMRTVLTVCGIAIGVLSVVIISTIGMLGKQSINSELDSIGISGLAVSVNTSVGGVNIYEEEIDEINKNSDVQNTMPLMVTYTYTKVINTIKECLVWGIDDDAKNIIKLDILHGRFINNADISAANQYCVVDEQLAIETYKRTNIVGKKIRLAIRGYYEDFEVVGVVSSGGNILQNLMGNYVPYFIYTPYTVVQKLSGRNDFDEVMVKLKEGANARTTADKITAALERNNGIKGSVKVENLINQKENLNNVLGIITFVLAAIAAISMIVSGLSIMTVMLVSVSERTREIGIMKSLGASNKIIIIEFLSETLLLSLIGSAIGIIAGIVITCLGCIVLNVPFLTDVPTLLFCIGFSMILGIIFGVYPALKAARLKPVDALNR